MTLDKLLKSFIDLLTIWEKNKTPADNLFRQYCRQNPSLGSRDRKNLATLFFESFRSRGPLLNALEEYNIPPHPLFLALSFFRFKGQSLLENNEEVYPPQLEEPLTQSEKEFLENISEVKDPDIPILGPNWLMEKLKNSLGNSFKDECILLSKQGATDLRVNTLKSTRDLALQALKDHDPGAIPTPHSPLGLRLSKRLPLITLPIYRHGAVEIQEEGSQLLTQYVPVKAGDSILDLCAGAGGKSLAFAATMKDQGKIILTDPNTSRLKKAQPRFERAGIQCAEILEQNAFDQRPLQNFDHVVLDVPCSGTGTLRRQPDLPWRLTPEVLDSYVLLQQEILHKGAAFVKEGGTLSYMTCSLLNQENEETIQSFQEADQSFETTILKRLTPKTTGTDGFFFALLRKKSS